ncbi:MAG TPA: alcohol dehydrogenase catalytic domain-containing protein [Candidatus Limnocylindrales bacterium]
MKALVYEGPWQMPVHDVPAPQPRRGEVVVAIRASGICGSDVHGFVGSTGRRRAGIVMGHEAAGEVSAVGADVDGLRAGDRVALRSSLACGECDECRAGRSNACSKRLGLGTDFDGAYAEAVAVPAALAVPLPDGVSYEQAAVIEPLAVALHAVELTPFGPDDDVAIIGAGAIGLLALLAVRDRGAARIVVTDRSRHRLALAHRLGADVTIEAQKGDPAAAIREATDGEGAAALIEAVGIAPTVEQSLAAARTGAHVTWVGNAALTVQVPMQDVVTRELTIRGAHGSSVEFDQAARLIASGRVDVRPLIERVAPLEDGPSIFRALGEGRLDAAKVILEPAPRRAAARARGSAATAGPA